MSTPDKAVVYHDDPTDLKSPNPTCYRSKVTQFTSTAAVTLMLRLNFQSVSDKIMLGAVGITFYKSD
jgi:hypothetical protein